MRDFPLISIIIVNYNGREHLDACLSSIQKTIYPNFEVLLVDNASTDGSVEYVSNKFLQVRIIQNKSNLGFAEGNNVGIRALKGDYAALLNNDTEVDPNWLSELIKIMRSDSSIGACACKIKIFDNRHIIASAGGVCNKFGYAWDRGEFEEDKGQYDNIEEVFYSCGAAMLVRLEAINKVGPFDSRYFIYHEDVDLCWRMRLAGYKVVYVPFAVVYHELGATMKRDLRFLYLMERNWICTVLKNYEMRTILKVLPLILFERAKKILTNIARKEYQVAYVTSKTMLWNLLNIFGTLRMHFNVRRIRNVSDTVIQRYMLGARRSSRQRP